MCNEETNDRACCCCGPSYIGVIVFGALTAVWMILTILGMIVPGEVGWDGLPLATEEVRA